MKRMKVEVLPISIIPARKDHKDIMAALQGANNISEGKSMIKKPELGDMVIIARAGKEILGYLLGHKKRDESFYELGRKIITSKSGYNIAETLTKAVEDYNKRLST